MKRKRHPRTGKWIRKIMRRREGADQGAQDEDQD